MASVAGYRAIIEATNEFKGFMNGGWTCVGGLSRLISKSGSDSTFYFFPL